MIPQTFGERLRVAMRTANVRNPDVANAAGVHVKTVSRWLSDRAEPEAGNVLAIAALLGVHAEWLGRGEGPMRREGAAHPTRTPAIRRRLPPDVYAVVHGYLERLERAGVPAVLIEEAERLLLDAAWTKLAGDGERADEVMISDVRAIWSFVHHTLTRDGYDLGPPDVRARRIAER